MPRKIIICDIDGTICDSSIRLKKINFNPKDPIESWPKDWGDHMEDKPMVNMIQILTTLFIAECEIWLVTIRNKHPSTKEWLSKNHIMYHELIELGDENAAYKSPAEIKEEWLQSLPKEDLEDIACCFEDSPSMIKMFRTYGLLCFDVGQFSGSM